jgi:multidrug resistance protein, MATE family
MQETARQGNLDWSERPFRELMRLGWPITLSTLSYSLMTLVDTLLLGHLGTAELAGVGLAGTAAFTLLCFSFGLLRGVKTLVSQAVGADRRDELGAYLGAAMFSAVAIGLVTIVLGQGLAMLLPRLAPTAAAGAAAKTYLSIRNLGAVFALLYVALREVRYGQGDARTPMIATVLANLLNIALAWLFIFVWKKGVAGAAVATVIAHAVEAGVVLFAQHLRGWGIAAMRRRHLRALWKIGLPTGIQFSLEVGSFALLAALIMIMGELEMAAHQIALQLIHFSFLPAFGVAEAASVLAGQAVGANRDDLVLRVSRAGMWATGIYTGACALVMGFGADMLVSIFTRDPSLTHVAVRLLYVAAVFQVFDAANIMGRGVLRGAGDVRFAAVVGVLTSWVFTPPLAWLLGRKLGLGALGGWLGICAEIIVGAALLWVRLERRSWHAAAAESRARMQADKPAPSIPPSPSKHDVPDGDGDDGVALAS